MKAGAPRPSAFMLIEGLYRYCAFPLKHPVSTSLETTGSTVVGGTEVNAVCILSQSLFNGLKKHFAFATDTVLGGIRVSLPSGERTSCEVS